MKILLDAGADLEAKNNNGDTPLFLTNDLGRASSVRFLLRPDANPSTCGTEGCRTSSHTIQFLRHPVEEDAIKAAKLQCKC